MKFCLINNLYPPLSIGGAERVVELISGGLSGLKQKGQVVVITSHQNNDEVLEDENVKIYRINPKNIFYYTESYKMPAYQKVVWHFFDLHNFLVAKKVQVILQKEKPDFVFTHNLKGLSYQISKVIHKLNLRHIHTLHDYQLIDPQGSLYRQGRNLEKLPLSLKIYKNICRKLFKRIDLVISPSKFVLDKHLQYGFFKNSRKEVLPNPADIPASSAQHQISDKIRLLYLGQIEEHKGIRFLIESFKDYQNDNFELNIVGDGSLLSDLLSSSEAERRLTTYSPRVRPRVDLRLNFLGKMYHNELSNIFCQSDITVVPSLWWDNSPTVIYESYAHQVPVLVSDAGGSKELVKDGETGYIFKSGDKGDFIALLDKIAQNKADLAKFGLSGYEFIHQYSVDNYVNKLLELCQDLRKS